MSLQVLNKLMISEDQSSFIYALRADLAREKQKTKQLKHFERLCKIYAHPKGICSNLLLCFVCFFVIIITAIICKV